jgi:hypothetical protein
VVFAFVTVSSDANASWWSARTYLASHDPFPGGFTDTSFTSMAFVTVSFTI